MLVILTDKKAVYSPAPLKAAIAKQKPYYFVMRDSSMANDSVATNFDQIFATYSPDTVRKVL